MKIFIKQIISFLILFFTRIDDKKLYWYDRGYNGSNLYFLRNEIYLRKLKYNKIYSSNYIKQEKKPLKNFKAVTLDMIEFYQSKLIIHTHGISYRPKKKQIVIDTWHGIPLKSHPKYALKKNEKSFVALNYVKSNQKYDYLLSTSQIATYFLNQFNDSISNNVIYTGYPRNDLILEKLNDSLKYKINPNYKTQKTLLYAPTYRSVKGSESWPINPLFESEIDLLKKYLNENNITFMIKPHPNEINEFNKLESKNIKVISSNWLENNKINFYSILSMIDILITDYSSIHYDFILSNKPIIFFNYDYMEYKQNRNLIVDNYNNWTPGHKAKSIEELINAIGDALEKDSFKKDRERVRNDIHIFKDNKSTERFIEFINNL